MSDIPIPELEVSLLNDASNPLHTQLMAQSQLDSLTKNLEVWTSSASNHALRYHTHGIIRYFGKFPPPIARHLIKSYTHEGDLVIDPMCGSGTTALESALLHRRVECMDVSPLSVLVSKVKTTHIKEAEFLLWAQKVEEIVLKDKSRSSQTLIGLRNPEHWFLPETTKSLTKIKKAIESLNAPEEIKAALMVTFVSIVRRVSRATSQQGRLFLDVETAEKDALPFFMKKAKANAKSLDALPTDSDISIHQASLLDDQASQDAKGDLLICHPPYFNNYKYSGVYSLELSWLNYDHASIRKQEVREAFKIGNPDKLGAYLDDMEVALKHCHAMIKKNGVMALMIGDTILREKYLPVTKLLLDRISDLFSVELVALRVPQFTEASWAASQRRLGGKVGVSLSDFVVILRKKDGK